MFHEAAPSAHSQVAQLVRTYPIKSEIVVSHVRQATHGRVCLANTHPFVRELWGRHSRRRIPRHRTEGRRLERNRRRPAD